MESKVLLFETREQAFQRLDERLELIQHTPLFEQLMDHLLQETIACSSLESVLLVHAKLDGELIGDPIPLPVVRAGHVWLDEHEIPNCYNRKPTHG